MTQEFKTISCPVQHSDCAALEVIPGLQQRLHELEEQVLTDALTGLINFRGFEQHLAQEIERTRRLEEPTSIIMIDIDHFKKVNDTYGHDVGNLALVHIAELLKATLRLLDLPCRFGGEEFALILPSTRLAAAVQVAERIRKKIQNSAISLEKTKLKLTISLGVTSIHPYNDLSVAEVLKTADSFLYQAKNTGRNCTCHPPIDTKTDVGSVSTKEKQELFAAFARKK